MTFYHDCQKPLKDKALGGVRSLILLYVRRTRLDTQNRGQTWPDRSFPIFLQREIRDFQFRIFGAGSSDFEFRSR